MTKQSMGGQAVKSFIHDELKRRDKDIKKWAEEHAMPPKSSGFEDRHRTIFLGDLLKYLDNAS